MGSDKCKVDASMLQICMFISAVLGSDKGKLDASVLQICMFVGLSMQLSHSTSMNVYVTHHQIGRLMIT